jgi:hypothetical protein
LLPNTDIESGEESDAYIERAMILSLKVRHNAFALQMSSFQLIVTTGPSLQLLNRMLVVEETFVQAYRAATTLLPPHQRVQLTPLTEALVSDYAVSIARCISYGHNLKVCRTERELELNSIAHTRPFVQLPYFSVNIIRMLSRRSGKLVPSFDLTAQEIMDGYVQRLESLEDGEDEGDGN